MSFDSSICLRAARRHIRNLERRGETPSFRYRFHSLDYASAASASTRKSTAWFRASVHSDMLARAERAKGNLVLARRYIEEAAQFRKLGAWSLP